VRGARLGDDHELRNGLLARRLAVHGRLRRAHAPDDQHGELGAPHHLRHRQADDDQPWAIVELPFKACTDAGAYSGVKFKASGTLSDGCSIHFSAIDKEHALPARRKSKRRVPGQGDIGDEARGSAGMMWTFAL
jgi:hypothetical protein